MSTVSRWEDNLSDLLQADIWRELHRKAKQVRPVRTNPGSYQMSELEMPETGEFVD